MVKCIPLHISHEEDDIDIMNNDLKRNIFLHSIVTIKGDTENLRILTTNKMFICDLFHRYFQ